MTLLRRQLNSILQAYTLKTYLKGFHSVLVQAPLHWQIPTLPKQNSLRN